jgi:hypothetical protein
MQNSQVYIRNLNLHKLILLRVVWKQVDAVLSTEAFQRAATPVLQVGLPTVSVTANNPNLAVGEECRIADLDTVVGEGVRSVDLKAARILSKVVATMWKVHRLWEILPTTSWVPGYSENPTTQQRLSHV